MIVFSSSFCTLVVEASIRSGHLWLRPSSQGEITPCSDGGNVTSHDQVRYMYFLIWSVFVLADYSYLYTLLKMENGLKTWIVKLTFFPYIYLYILWLFTWSAMILSWLDSSRFITNKSFDTKNSSIPLSLKNDSSANVLCDVLTEELWTRAASSLWLTSCPQMRRWTNGKLRRQRV